MNLTNDKLLEISASRNKSLAKMVKQRVAWLYASPDVAKMANIVHGNHLIIRPSLSYNSSSGNSLDHNSSFSLISPAREEIRFNTLQHEVKMETIVYTGVCVILLIFFLRFWCSAMTNKMYKQAEMMHGDAEIAEVRMQSLLGGSHFLENNALDVSLDICQLPPSYDKVTGFFDPTEPPSYEDAVHLGDNPRSEIK